MIAYLSGTILSRAQRTITLDVQGVGYLVYVPRGLAEKVIEGTPLKLHIHTNVREDDLSLFGFETSQEWQFFKMLLSVSGIGPKSALEILNAPIAKVQNAIVKRDFAFLTKIPGIGKKTAERISVDLSGKLKEEPLTQTDERMENTSSHHEKEDIIQALVSLGYHRHHVIAGLKKIPETIIADEAIIKYFLQNT